MKSDIIEATAQFHPQIFDIHNKGSYWFEDEEDYVIDYNPDLMVSYSKDYGTYQISYQDWYGDYDNPIPVLLRLLKGFNGDAEADLGMSLN